MTAVAVQRSAYPAQEQHPNPAVSSSSSRPSVQQHPSRKSSAPAASFAPSRVARDASAPANGSSAAMSSYNLQPHQGIPNGLHQAQTQQYLLNGHDAHYINGASAEDDAASGRRPSSAPGNRGQLAIRTTSFDDSDRDQPRRLSKPLLLRSKSEHILRNYDDLEQTDDEVYDWSARHGFEDHYQSEDIISHLANVSGNTFLDPPSDRARQCSVSPQICRAVHRRLLFRSDSPPYHILYSP
ncbi:hypothetical protein BKA67DRAFT_581076 [Truncatella angustata]|uniref:Uncharacterized protein n=1 Tax=Truncatella angustata TaxID=152316 RepID=A0A9P8UD90_9PEZI|nr:uncharacterized protein BKA67DRAFT_581076 [Truncatella angustata]KAH6646957.1 hypothetical protein BKA67DRAFT_581076 [Truncatella angustata]